LLGQLAARKSGAADEVLAHSAEWTGQTQRSPKADQSILTALDLPDIHSREAALAAELALDAVPQNEAGLSQLKEALGDPSQRVWALWMLGALGNRGVDPEHTAKISSPIWDPGERTSPRGEWSLPARTDETVVPRLDRFQNDPSPVVQERAARGLATGATRDQRDSAASIAGWLMTPLPHTPATGLVLPGSRDISGQNHGTNSRRLQSGG
jgi:hypothetical protein